MSDELVAVPSLRGSRKTNPYFLWRLVYRMYPAHGSGFVLIVTEGNIDAFNAALAPFTRQPEEEPRRPADAKGCADHCSPGVRYGAGIVGKRLTYKDSSPAPVQRQNN